MNHTIGPWEQDRFNISVKPGLYYCLKNSSDTSSHELDANAKLIAAAPDLLEACKAIVDAGSKRQIDAPMKLGLIIHNAIAKAEGGHNEYN